jgi:preprotein translocase subunit SecB
MADDEQLANQDNGEQKMIRPQKIYLKDISYETPNSPQIFTQDWKPNLGVEIDSQRAMIADDTYEIVLRVTVTVSVDDKTAFLIEVHQAGIFTLKGLEPEQLKRAQNVYCLNTLYPYASATISDLVTKGGFPQLLLVPVSFASMYERGLMETEAQTADEESSQH